MTDAKRIVVSALFGAVLLMLVLPAAAEEKASVLTVFRVLVGKPEAVAAPTTQVLDFPGPFVMLGRGAEQEARDVLQLMDKLKENYRLTEVRIARTSVEPFLTTRETTLAVPGDTVHASVTLLASDESKVLYGVTLTREGEKPSSSNLLIARGERGVVGTRDGIQAPYLFLTIEPVLYSRTHGPLPAVYPEPITRNAPEYPADAKKARIEGVVILDGTIDTKGVVRDLKPVRSEPLGLTEAAIKAVSQWRYTPARDASGKAITMPLTLTISFTLQ
jgi:TonB family protein